MGQKTRKADKRKKLLEQRKKRNSKRPQQSSPEQISKRISYRRPRAWNGEAIEDLAIFDSTVRKSLSSELIAQADAVCEALKLVSKSTDELALERVSDIPRSSPFSQWRLLIRGLVSWYRNDSEAAEKFWSRLDRHRRPARIAFVLTSSRRTDLEKVNTQPESPEFENDPTLVSAAKLVKRIRVDRPALAEASAETGRSEPGKELRLGTKKLSWLKDFSTKYRRVEPGLVRALQLAAIEHAMCQPYVDIFEDVKKAFVGPPHDPNNTLSHFQYSLKFSDMDDVTERMMRRYLTQDLPNCKDVSTQLRDALLSVVYLSEARAEMVGKNNSRFFMGRQEETKLVEQNLNAAVRAYPKHLDAHKQYVDWVEQGIEDDRAPKTKRESFEKRLPSVMEGWSNAMPDCTEPRLWLVDHYLENEEMDKAQPHVEWLKLCRSSDPRVRSIPWKWQILEAMRLSRRKNWLSEVPEKLDTAESIWPSWLSKEWLPYLRVAYTLRCKDSDQFEALRKDAIAKADGKPLTDAVMMLAAAQRMRVPAADLKPLRQPVDSALKKLTSIKTEDLISAGSFFWDLQRTALEYPAYRMHGSKFCKEHLKRFRGSIQTVTPPMYASIFWISEHRILGDDSGLKLPVCIQKASKKDHRVAAAKLNAASKLKYGWHDKDYRDDLKLVRNAAAEERDPFYRHLYNSIVAKIEEKIAWPTGSFSGGTGGGFFDFMDDLASRFNRYQDDFDDDEEEDDDDDDDDDMLDYDPQCDCEDCTAARKAASRRIDLV